MLTSEFFSIVLPPQGFYCAAELTTKKREHRFVNTIEELCHESTALDDEERDVYFGVASYATGANRTAANSAQIRSFFCDVDVGIGKPYRDVAGALDGLAKWCAFSNFPVPIVVGSGGGIHCYWPFSEAVSVGTWRPLAESFKRGCAEAGFDIDYSVSADAARVLRVPETHNRKRIPHKLVRIRTQEATVLEFSDYARLLEPWKEKKTTLAKVVPNFDPLFSSAPAYAVQGASYKTDLSDITTNDFNKILALGDDGCKQIQFYVNNAKNEGMEPLWRGVMSIAKECENGEEHARVLAAMHPYDEERTATKYSSILGPYLCDTFDGTSPNICKGCKFQGKIPSPIVLGKTIKPSVVIEINESTQETKTVSPPDGYSYSDKGVGYLVSDETGIPRTTIIADLAFYASATYDRDGERFAQFTYIEHGVFKSTVQPLSILAGREEAIKAFAKIGILVPNGQNLAFNTYLKITVAEAKLAPVLTMPTNLGWQPDNSFAYDGRVFHDAGERVIPMYGFDNINSTTGTKGTLDNWRLVMASVMRLERWDIVSMMLIGFASPLMKFTGLNGVTFHLCGNDSGKGKTLCQRLASSVWGVPDKFRVTPNTSALAMINRLGMLGNLPLLVDEITHKGRAESEWFPEFLSQMSDGRGKDRMESQTNSERRNTTTWASLALMTSNKHMLDYLTAEREHGSEGEIRRLLEITFDREFLIDDLTKSMLYDILPNNYGTPGEAYARWLVRNHDTARDVTKSTYAEIFKHFGATGDERFWIAGCACILAGARLISKTYGDILEVPLGKVAAFLYDTVKAMRLETSRMKRTALDVLNEFTKRNFGKLVAVNDHVARLSGIEIAETLDRRDLCGRVEKNRDGWVDYFIEEREMKSFCSSLSYGYTEFKRDIQVYSKISYVNKDILIGTKGPCMVVKCMHIRQKADAVMVEFQEAANG